MGLDSVELIMEFEKAFEIRIPDQEAEKLRTVGEVHNYIWNRLDNYHSNKCNSQILFYKFKYSFFSISGTRVNLYLFISSVLL